MTIRTAQRVTLSLLVSVLMLPSVAHAAAPTDLVLRITATSFRVGTNGFYNITVSNVGSQAADENIHVLDKLPPGLSFVSGSSGWNCSAVGQSVDCYTDPPLAVGATRSLTFTVSVCTDAFPSVVNSFTLFYPNDTNSANNAVSKATSVKSGVCVPNTATPTSRPGTPAPTRTPTRTINPTNTRTPVAAATDLSLSKVVSGLFFTGRTGIYFLTVRNVGAVTTNAAMTITDTLPDSLGYVSFDGAGWSCSANGQVVTCTNGDALTSGSSIGLTLTVSISRNAFPSVTNFATLAYSGDTNISNNTARRPTTIRLGQPVTAGTATATVAGATAPPARTPTATPTSTRTPTAVSAAATDLLLTKVNAGSFTVGHTGSYFLTVTNLGPAATNAPITVIDDLPNGLSFLSGTGVGWSCSASGQTVACTNIDPLPSGSGTSITLAVSVGSAAFPSVTNTATLTYRGDTDASNNTSRKPTTVRSGSGTTAARARHSTRRAGPHN